MDGSGQATKWVYEGISYVYDGSLLDFRRSERGLEPYAMYLAKQNKDKPPELPYIGEPNSHQKTPDGKKERWYGDNGLPRKDRHHTDHGNPANHPVPHDHDWGFDDEGNWTLGKGYPSPKVEKRSRYDLDKDFGKRGYTEEYGIALGESIIIWDFATSFSLVF